MSSDCTTMQGNNGEQAMDTDAEHSNSTPASSGIVDSTNVGPLISNSNESNIKNNVLSSHLGNEGQDSGDVIASQIVLRPSFTFERVQILTGVWNEFVPKASNSKIFLKGCKWSPDGTCLLTNSADAVMRLFDLPLELYNRHQLSTFDIPEMKPSVRSKVGGMVYDYDWYPLMTSTDARTCCFVTTSFCNPVQMWDAFDGSLRCSYRGYNVQDELHAALSVAFSQSGEVLLCGYKDCVNIFNTDVPGRNYTSISTKKTSDQKGIVSCIAVNPDMPNIFAAGTYSKTVGLYSMDGHAMCLLTGQSGGLTQLVFSHDGTKLFTVGRKDLEILCWDLRQLGQLLCVMRRPHNTNQRIYIDLSSDNRYLFSGSSDGNVRVWDLHSMPVTSSSETSVIEPKLQWHAHNDCVNGVSVHRYVPVVATASGQRCIPQFVEGNDDDMFIVERPQGMCEDSIKLWWTGNIEATSACEPSETMGATER